MSIDSGALSVGQRLDRIEADLKEILRRFEVFATDAELKELKGKVDHINEAGTRHAQDAFEKSSKVESRVEAIEKSYLSRGVAWNLVAFIVVQMLVIVGLGLGLIYEILNRPLG